MAETEGRRGVVRWFRSRRFVIVDRSMVPTLEPGDRVLVDARAFRSDPPRPGTIVALSDPAEPARWLVKRIAAVGPADVPVPVLGLGASGELPTVPVPPGWVFVLSDALDVGRDSRNFGPVPAERLRGQVWRRIGPAGRRGPL